MTKYYKKHNGLLTDEQFERPFKDRSDLFLNHYFESQLSPIGKSQTISLALTWHPTRTWHQKSLSFKKMSRFCTYVVDALGTTVPRGRFREWTVREGLSTSEMRVVSSGDPENTCTVQMFAIVNDHKNCKSRVLDVFGPQNSRVYIWCLFATFAYVDTLCISQHGLCVLASKNQPGCCNASLECEQ